jgi:hypothetical protein
VRAIVADCHAKGRRLRVVGSGLSPNGAGFGGGLGAGDGVFCGAGGGGGGGAREEFGGARSSACPGTRFQPCRQRLTAYFLAAPLPSFPPAQRTA